MQIRLSLSMVYLFFCFPPLTVKGNGDAVVLLTDQSYDTNSNETVNGIEIVLTTSSIVIMDFNSKEIYNITENVSLISKTK
jgi:hypothetical protein